MEIVTDEYGKILYVTDAKEHCLKMKEIYHLNGKEIYKGRIEFSNFHVYLDGEPFIQKNFMLNDYIEN